MSSPTPPEEKRLGELFPIEDDRWHVTLGGWLGDHPPTDEAGFLEFARSLPASDIAQIAARAEPLGDFVVHKLPSNLRRHYEKLDRVPEGYLAASADIAHRAFISLMAAYLLGSGSRV